MGQAMAGGELTGHFPVPCHKSRAGYHFRHDQPCPEPGSKIAHRAVCDPSHGRKNCSIWQSDTAYAHFGGMLCQFIALKLYNGSNLVTD